MDQVDPDPDSDLEPQHCGGKVGSWRGRSEGAELEGEKKRQCCIFSCSLCNKNHNLVTMSFINIFLSMLIYLSDNK